MTYQVGLHPSTWATMAALIAENDPLGEGTLHLAGADLLVVGFDDLGAVGFIAGFSQPEGAVCSFVRLAKRKFGSRKTVRALFEAWAAQAAKRGHAYIFAGVPREPRDYRRVVEIMLEAAGFTRYYPVDPADPAATEHDWFRTAVPARAREAVA